MARRMLLSAICLALCLISRISAADDSSVLVLTPENFEKEVGQDQGALVEFYAPWCGHCKKLAPEYEILGSAFKKVKHVSIAKVDCDAHKSLCSKYSVSGYPTIKWFPKGSLTPKDYSGARTAEELVKFVNEEGGANAKLAVPLSEVVVLTPSNFNEVVLDSTKNVLVEFYAPWCGHCQHLAPVYEQLAAAFKAEKNVVVAKLDADAHKELGNKYDVSGFPTLKFFSKSNKEGEACEGRSLEELVDFLNEKSGTFRTPKGGLSDQAGKLPTLDAIAEEFIAAAADARSAVSKKFEDAIAKLEDSDAGYGTVYSKLVKSVIAKGDEYLQKEHGRLTRLLSGAVNPLKADELTIKKNIISSFFKQ